MKEALFALSEPSYADFQSRLTPNIAREKFIGVRVPLLRKLAKKMTDEQKQKFLRQLPHPYFEENMLHSLLISEIKEFETCMDALDRFLPYVDNWAVCDILSPKIFSRQKQEVLPEIRKWIDSEHPYTCRFGIGMLMQHFLDADFHKEYLLIPAKIRTEEYYVNMMIAWYYATALTKQWEAALPVIEGKQLEKRVHNKAIQKAVESRRISQERKDLLRRLRY